MHKYNYEHCISYTIMSKNDVSFKRGLPLYVAGFACIASGLFSLSPYPGVLGALTGILAFIAAGLMLYFGWLMQMGMDTEDYDNGSGGGGRIFLDKLAA
jgi:hypothetical protein